MSELREEITRANVRRWLSERSGVQLLVLVEELAHELIARAWPGARLAFELGSVLTRWMEYARRADAMRAEDPSSRG